MREDHYLAKRIIKFGYFVSFPYIHNVDDSRVRLWRSVLDMALADMLRGEEFVNRESGEEEGAWEELLDWFITGSEHDFSTVCYLSGLPEWGVRQKFNEILFGDLPKELRYGTNLPE